MSESIPGAPSGPLSSPDAGSTAVAEREEQREYTEPGDHERFSHYAPKDKIMESMVTGQPLIALCGKVWVPSRDPQRFPVCPQCKAIYEGLPGGSGDSDDQ